MFPFWSRATEEHVAALLLARNEQAAEHDTAVRRLIELAHEGDEFPPLKHPETTRSLLAEMAAESCSDLEEIAPGVYRGPRAP
jgi:hypothetical protein